MKLAIVFQLVMQSTGESNLQGIKQQDLSPQVGDGMACLLGRESVVRREIVRSLPFLAPIEVP